MGWLTNWIYRKSITLSRASGVVTNYQMKLLVGESAGATGEDVDCNGHCLADFDDLRFTTSDGQTLLDYWIESISGTTPNQLATVWVEFGSIGTGATTFYMYYGATPSDVGVVYYNGQAGDGKVQIGMAYGDGDYGFTKYAPILAGGPGAYDSKMCFSPFVIQIGSTFYMYYSGYSSADIWSTCLATSSDGISYTKSGSNPILQKGAASEWDDGGAYLPIVYDTGIAGSKRYRMLYTGFTGSVYQIGYAYSSDGISWTKGAANPVIPVGSGGQWDDIQAVTGSNIILDSGTFYVYYGGYDGTRYQAGLVTFTDFEEDYTKSGSNPVISARTSAKQNLTAQTNSGTKTVTVADTSVFQENEPVFLCESNFWEFNRVDSITDATHLELLNNAERNYPESSTIRSWMYGSIYTTQFSKSGSNWKQWTTCFSALYMDYPEILITETTGYHTSTNGTTWTNDYIHSPPLAYNPSVSTWDKVSVENMRIPGLLVQVPFSNGFNTFLFFDDFLQSGLGTQWSFNGTPTIAGSIVTLDSGATWDAIKATSYTVAYARFRARFAQSDCQNHAIGLMNSAIINWPWQNDSVYFLGVAPQRIYCISSNNGSLTQNLYLDSVVESQYYLGELLWKSGECKYYIDGALIATYTTNIADEACSPRADGAHADGLGSIAVDWIFVSQYLPTEPAWGSWGEEETSRGLVKRIEEPIMIKDQIRNIGLRNV